MSFTIEYLEFAMLVFVRVASIVSVTPFFGNNAVPVKVKAAISLFLSIIIMNTTDYIKIGRASCRERV